MTEYNVDFFIAKFEAIPEEEWMVGRFENEHGYCALGHCGDRGDISSPPEAIALGELIYNKIQISVENINDEKIGKYQQPTPKQRILAALRDIKVGQK